MSRTRLVLVGGGHTHLHVLRSLAMRPEARLDTTLVSPFPRATYTGMVPGVLAGQYALGEAQIDLRALAAAAGVRFIEERVVRVDAAKHGLETEGGLPQRYDLLSLDIGSRPAAAELVAPGAPVVMVKPIEVAATQMENALAPTTSRRRPDAVVVGAGAGGVEIAFALAARLARAGGGSITLVGRDDQPAAERGSRTAALVRRAFARHAIAFVAGVDVTGVDERGVHCSNGEVLEMGLCVWTTGAVGPPLLAESGVAVDERGFVRVGDDLRSLSHPHIFAAGDCATLDSHPRLPKAGVYAVRQGPVLARNLRLAACRPDARLRAFAPQRRFLSILNTCDGRAIASYAGFALQGRWAWRLKDRIDRAFIRRYDPPRPGR
jgi:selenide,water dikinase